MYVAFGYAAQRAVVDVDVELGLVKVVQIASSQDVGTVINPAQLLGQVEGGIAQGLGFALMERVVVRDGHIRNPDLQDYLIPTIADVPEVVADFVEVPQPGMPFGWKGAGSRRSARRCRRSRPRSGTRPVCRCPAPPSAPTTSPSASAPRRSSAGRSRRPRPRPAARTRTGPATAPGTWERRGAGGHR